MNQALQLMKIKQRTQSIYFYDKLFTYTGYQLWVIYLLYLL